MEPKHTLTTFAAGEEGMDIEYKRKIDRHLQWRSPTSARPMSTSTPPCQASRARRVTTFAAGWRSRAAWTSRLRDDMSMAGLRLSSAWSTANPFPSAIMGRVCPAPCESDCNRNRGRRFRRHQRGRATCRRLGVGERSEACRVPARKPARRVAVVGGGPAGLAADHVSCASRGHGVTDFRSPWGTRWHAALWPSGATARRAPSLAAEDPIASSIIGVDGASTNTQDWRRRCRPRRNSSADFDAILLGAWARRPAAPCRSPEVRWNAELRVNGIEFLEAFNTGRLTCMPRPNAIDRGWRRRHLYRRCLGGAPPRAHVRPADDDAAARRC